MLMEGTVLSYNSDKQAAPVTIVSKPNGPVIPL